MSQNALIQIDDDMLDKLGEFIRTTVTDHARERSHAQLAYFIDSRRRGQAGTLHVRTEQANRPVEIWYQPDPPARSHRSDQALPV